MWAPLLSTRGQSLQLSLCCPSLYDMAQPLQVRRSARQPEPRRLLADEQAWRQFQALEALEIERAIREAVETVESSDSSEREMADGEVSEKEEERKVRPADQNTPPWSQELRDVHLPRPVRQREGLM